MNHNVSTSKIMYTPDTTVNRHMSTPVTTINRHMSTPDSGVTRHITGSINKSLLTPCRRIGLGRPSTGSSKKFGQTGMFTSPAVSNENSPITSRDVKSSPPSNNKGVIICPLATRNHENILPHQKNELKNTPVSSRSNRHTNCNQIKNNTIKQCGIKRCLSDISESKENKNILIQEMETDDNTETMHNESAVTDNLVIDKNIAESYSEQTCLQENSLKKQKLGITNRMVAEIAERILKKKKQLEDLKIQESYAKKNDLKTLRELTKTWRKAGQEALHRMLKMAGDMGYKVTLLELVQQYNFPIELIRYNTELEDFECDDGS